MERPNTTKTTRLFGVNTRMNVVFEATGNRDLLRTAHSALCGL